LLWRSFFRHSGQPEAGEKGGFVQGTDFRHPEISDRLQTGDPRGILAGLLLIALGFGMGWVLGRPGGDTRAALALGTGQRNIAAAQVVASESFSDPSVVLMVIVVTIVGLLTLMPLCHVLANHGAGQSTN
jgi:predicted Na+-dependent transporter